MEVDAIDAQIQIGKLRGHARVELDDGQPVARRIVKELHVEQPVRKADRLQEAPRYSERPHAAGIGQIAGIGEAHEGLGAGIHCRFDEAQRSQFAGEHVAIEIVLQRHFCELFQRNRKRRSILLSLFDRA